MKNALVIAEKPSVAKAISDVLGAKSRRDGSTDGTALGEVFLIETPGHTINGRQGNNI